MTTEIEKKLIIMAFFYVKDGKCDFLHLIFVMKNRYG